MRKKFSKDGNANPERWEELPLAQMVTAEEKQEGAGIMTFMYSNPVSQVLW
jgi:hypothetical protein